MKFIFSCAGLALFLTACGQSSDQPKPTAAKETVRTDVAPIEKRLPKLGQLQSISWTSTLLSKDSAFSPPVLDPAYRVKGLAQLAKGRADEISQQFQWQRTSHDWKPALTVTNLNLDSAEWSQSAAFTKDCKPQEIPGQLFFERRKGIVYFDLEIK